MRKIVVFISGRGSNLACLADACSRGNCEAEIAAVISDQPEAAGLKLADERNLQTIIVDRKLYESRESFENAIIKHLDTIQASWLVLAGFMRILSSYFVRRYSGKLINIHPSLLPSFVGLETHKRALLSGVKWHGATVHFVNEELDGGPIIAQAAVPVHLHDTVESLAERVLRAEHRLLSGVLIHCVNGKIRLDGKKVIYDRSLNEGVMSWF